MKVFLEIMIFVFGLCFGSFVNMLVYRIAIKYGLRADRQVRSYKNKNRSFCDFCKRQLSWYENIPVLSWIMQKGKTRCCQKKLPIAYPVVEILMGILFLMNFEISQFHFVSFEMTILYLINFVVVMFLVFSAVFDLKYMILPDFSTVILVIIGLVLIGYELLNGHVNLFLQNLITGIIVTLFFLFLHLITKGKGMGMGDVKLVFFIGLFLGWQKTIVTMYVAFIAGAIVGIFLMAFKKLGRKAEIPFGPFLIFGTFFSWWVGDNVWKIVEKFLY
jgi:prepilin signal peptidase PulO-like enzyme (type II secretory pathway)